MEIGPQCDLKTVLKAKVLGPGVATVNCPIVSLGLDALVVPAPGSLRPTKGGNHGSGRSPSKILSLGLSGAYGLELLRPALEDMLRR
jgi:hypothetical protein